MTPMKIMPYVFFISNTDMGHYFTWLEKGKTFLESKMVEYGVQLTFYIQLSISRAYP